MGISFLCLQMVLLFYIFMTCILIQTAFAVWMLWAMPSSNNKLMYETIEKAGLSIIICAKNEAQNLEKNLPHILDQRHPNLEIIVVNDASEDETGLVLQHFAAQYNHLHIINIPLDEEHHLPGKKWALSRGLAAAKNENLLLCDADCRPTSPHWAELMAKGLQGPVEIVAGYGAYTPKKNCLNIFIRWETLHTFLQYSTYSYSGIPYMAVGRNLACTKSILLEAQKDPLWATMPSGDDDLLIRLKANKSNMSILADSNAFTMSEAKVNLKDWLAQKQRHLSTGKLYKKPIQFLLGIYAVSHGLMWLLWITLLFAGKGYLISSMMMLRCILVWSLWAISAENLKEKKLMLFLPLCDIAWAFYNLILSPYIFYKTKKQWK